MTKKTLAVVLVVKDEVQDLRCWLAWYHLQGFDTCIVYDDYSTDGTWELLQRAAEVQDIRVSRTVGSQKTPYYPRQELCYRTALAQYREEFEWIAFFDADEYIWFQSGLNAQQFLARFEDADGIAINWCNYGSSDHALKPLMLPIEAYTWHGDENQLVNRHVKSIVRPDRVGSHWLNVHAYDVAPDRYVDASHRRCEWAQAVGILNRMPDWSVAKIIHFQCRSMEHFVERLRKRPDLEPRAQTWRVYDVNQQEDRSPLTLLPELHRQIAKYETSAPEGAPSTAPTTRETARLTRGDLIDKLWQGQSPFDQFPRQLYEPDVQGWGHTHHFLVESIAPMRPDIIVEVGVWKGASTIKMASRLQELGLAGAVIAVDTWLGSWDQWINTDGFDHLGWDHGYPALNRKFMNNILVAGLQDYVVPLPLDSLNAARVLKHLGVRADIIHIDAAHDYDSVAADLRAWWSLLRPGGLLIGEAYYEHTHFPGVKAAFDHFFSPGRSSPLENVHGKCRAWKRDIE